MDFCGKNITVIGLGISNMPLIKWLLGKGAKITARDKKTEAEIPEKAAELKSLGVKCILGENYLENLEGDYIFCTPGIRPDLPQIEKARAAGSVITSEMEQFFNLCPCKIIGITGSDGKTTTTTIIAKMLEKAGLTAHLGGNIGTPLLDKAEGMQPTDYAVVELSSFQLMLLSKSPNITLIINISPNHLDYHKGMEEYISAKSGIFRYQTARDKAVFNRNNPVSAALADMAPGQVAYFGAGGDVEIRDGGIYAGNDRIMSLGEILIPGAHNAENYAAACAVLLGIVPYDAMAAVAREFPGVAHRLELVREIDGVKYYNDSMASSPTRTAAGLKCFADKVVLIAGGYDKKIPFDDFGTDVVKNVKRLYLIGQTAEKIKAAVENAAEYQENMPQITMCGDMKKAAALAKESAETGDIVLMSPACASFDQYPNFEVRGNEFKYIVNNF